MKRIFTIVFLSITTFILAQNKYQNQYFFYENKGQIIDQKAKPNPEVKYLFNSVGLNVQIKKTGFSYDVYEVEKKASKKKLSTSKDAVNPKLNKKQNQETEYTSKYHRVDINLVNANTNVQIEAEGKSPDYENYYNLEHNPKGVEKVHRYQRIIYKNIYNNVDLVFFKPEDSSKTVEYNFLVRPGGKVSDIKMKFDGAKTKLKDGKLAMALRFGEMQENIPSSWIEQSNSKQNIAVNFKDLGNQTFGFDSEVNTSDKTIVIDPVPTRIWGSYYGGYQDDELTALTVDKNGNIYTGGTTTSSVNIATSGSYMSTNPQGGSGNIISFGMKMDPNGKKIWGTYINALVTAVSTNNKNEVVFVGHDYLQSDLGTLGTHKPTKPKHDRDGFLLKLDNSGARVWGTYYGGTNEDIIYGITSDSQNQWIVVGYTESNNNISTPNVHQQQHSQYTKDGFIGIIDNSGQWVMGTYYGDSGTDILYDVKTDETDNIFVLGVSDSNSNMTFGNSYQPNNNGVNDAILASFTKLGKINFATFVGTNGQEEFKNLSYFKNKVLISGTTSSKQFPTTSNAPYATPQNLTNISSSAFCIFDNNGNIVLSSYYPALLKSNTFDTDGNFYLAGQISQQNFATPNAFQTSLFGTQNSFISKYDKNAQVIWRTYYGGDGVEKDTRITFDETSRSIIIGGSTLSRTRIATPGANQTFPYGNFWETFLGKLQDCSTMVVASSNSPICVGDNIELKASGGTNYSWTGPNGFSSILQNPIIYNATTANSGVYSCVITGSGSCDGTYTVNVFIGDNEKPIPDNPNLPKLTGNCKFVITTIPIATDKCAGKITATTTDPLSYSLPGNYTITWTYNDGNGNTETQTQQVEITDHPKPTGNAVQNFCVINRPKISDIQVVGASLIWYDASGTILPTNTALVDNTKYYVTQNNAGCESSKLEILVNVSDPVAPAGNALQSFCIGQHPTLADIAITGQNIKWYNAANVLLTQTTALVDGETYYATQTISTCESINKLAVKVAVNNSSISASNYVEPAFCNDTIDDFKFINLEDYRTKLISTITGLQFTFYDSNNKLVLDFTKAKLDIGHNLFNVEIKNTVGCLQWFTLEFNLNKKPKLSLQPEVEFCAGLDAELNAGDCLDCTFQWNTGETSQIIKTQTEGTYTVIATTKVGCQNTVSVIVKKAKLATIKNIIIENNIATVVMSEDGYYLYSTDNISWQNSNQFTLENGTYTIFVKTKAGCLLDQRNISIFEIPNAFSPNADGVNDTWRIKGLENYKESQVIVMDRFGKKIFETKVNGIFEWNGKINGNPIPTDTYWYIINLSDGRIFKGFLVLKNYN